MINVLSIIKDNRINATSVLVEMPTGEYLSLTEGAEDNLDIQRKIVKGFKPYERLRQDLREGCIIPPIVLGIKLGLINAPTPDHVDGFISSMQSIDSNNVFIIDGLQRTAALKNVQESLTELELDQFNNRPLRVEVWPDISLSALTYRMILLNAGQKPMSLKHQLEVVSRPLCDVLLAKYSEEGNSIEIYREKDLSRRSGAGQYQFSIIASAFQAFVQKSPHIDIRNEVIADLNKIDVLEDYASSIGDSTGSTDLTNSFIAYIGFLIQFDHKLCDVYKENTTIEVEERLPTGVNILTRDTFHLGLAAAFGWCLAHKRDALGKAIEKLFEILASDESDPLAIERLEKIQTGFRRRDNVGEQTRNLIFNGFKEFFRSEGLTKFEQCWTQA